MKKSIAQIAKLAGVSKTAVSLIINGKSREHRISAKTEARVLALVKKINFSPSQFARGFRQKKTRTVGLVVADITNRFFSLLAKSIENSAQQNGFNLIIANTNDNEDMEKNVVQTLLDKSVDGLILSSIQKRDQLWKLFEEYNKRAVYIDRRIEGNKLPCVTSDNFAGARDLVDYFIKQGAHTVAFIGGLAHISTNHDRFEGYKKALEDHGIPVDDKIIAMGAFTVEGGYESAKRLFAARPELPDAVFTASYTILEGMLKYFKESRGAIPKGLKIGTFDDHPLLDFLPVPVISVRQDWKKMGEASFEILMREFEGKEKEPDQVIKTELVIR